MVDINEIKEKFPDFVCEGADGKPTLNLIQIFSVIEDCQDSLNEKDYQINYLMKEIDKLKKRIK